MDRQEMFDKMVRGLAAQGWHRARNAEDTACAYRSPSGLKCAIGQLMPDGPACNYGSSVRQLLRAYPNALGVIVAPSDLEFLTSCQIAHDAGREPGAMRQNFRRLAQNHNLTWPSDVP